MADLTPRMSSADYRQLAQRGSAGMGRGGRRLSKYGNRKTLGAGGLFDSAKEARTFDELALAMRSSRAEERVVDVKRSVRFLLIEARLGERACNYEADFVVTYADGRVEVIDTKSEITRRNRAYVIKRKLMLERHGVRIREV
jgi:hypothetical protein